MKLLTCLVCVLMCASCLGTVSAQAPRTDSPFYAMDTNIWSWQGRTPEEVAKLLKSLGYDGYGHGGTQDIDAYLAALDAQGLGLFSTYVGLDLDGDPKIDHKVSDVFRKFKDRNAMLWLFVQSRKYAPDSDAGDAAAVEAIRRLADEAHEQNVKIALYPHTGFYVENLDDALRIAEKVNRRNVGVTFNLCHWLKVDGDTDPTRTLQQAMPYLFQVSVNGADSGDTRSMNWDRLIQPLDSGTYDVARLLRTLRELGYTGPIALQGYGIKGDPKQNLARSIQAWRKMVESKKGSDAKPLERTSGG
ncbi:MAG: sugar phosphate isomerase/epimerase [Phycisphaerae bacterium]|nr:sugar phosphate isomerase/epimerase [Phycisphaerae bacterium]